MLKISYSILFILCSLSSFTQTSLEQKVKVMVGISGSSDIVYSALEKSINAQKTLYSDLPDKEWEDLKGNLIDSLQNVMLKHTISIYTDYLSEADIDRIIEFHSTEVGQKLRLHQDSILARSINISMDVITDMKEMVYQKYQERLETEFNTESTDCDCAKVGNFITTYGEFEYFLERTKTEQIELFEDYKTTYDVKWIKDCMYTLEAKESNDPEINLVTNGPSSMIKVYGCNGDEFRFIIYLKKYDAYVHGLSKRQ